MCLNIKCKHEEHAQIFKRKKKTNDIWRCDVLIVDFEVNGKNPIQANSILVLRVRVCVCKKQGVARDKLIIDEIIHQNKCV